MSATARSAEWDSTQFRVGRTNGVVVDLVVTQVWRKLAGNSSVHSADGVVQHDGSSLAWPVRPEPSLRFSTPATVALCGRAWPRAAGSRSTTHAMLAAVSRRTRARSK